MSAELDFGSCSEEQLWCFVASHLERQGIGVVLVGGAVVAVYTQGAYRSGDLDFVQVDSFGRDVDSAMAEIGFRRQGRHYVHPECDHLFVEFVSGPLGVGEDTEIVPSERIEGDVRLRILSPTDCVRDRLASYIHFRARECLDQAVLVARAQHVDWESVESWCRGEGTRGPGAFAELRRLVAKELG
ncbi:MAG TPA: hypothetical protein VGB42_03030 [Candidatus Thermoplasmatota archaeon]